MYIKSGLWRLTIKWVFAGAGDHFGGIRYKAMVPCGRWELLGCGWWKSNGRAYCTGAFQNGVRDPRPTTSTLTGGIANSVGTQHLSEGGGNLGGGPIGVTDVPSPTITSVTVPVLCAKQGNASVSIINHSGTLRSALLEMEFS